jgi:SOS-response transcriptional repressor LexA
MANSLTSQIIERVEERLKVLRLTERAASMRVDGKPDLIRNWRTKNVMPRLDSLVRLADALHTTPDWLAFGTGAAESLWVPKISWVNAGAFGVSDAVVHLDDVERIEVSGLPEGDWFALEVQGDSMDRISPPESIILVNRADKRLVNNACYVIQDGEGGATYKRYRQNPIRFEPVSTNPNHDSLFPDRDNTPTIFGRVGRSYIDM